MRIFIHYLIVVSTGVFASTCALAQGQDGTPADRDILIMAELLPGFYSNANQSYFDSRLKKPASERHALSTIKIEPLNDDEISAYTFSATFKSGDAEPKHFMYTLDVDRERSLVRMKTYQYVNGAAKKYLQGCDLLWRQHSGQFTSTQASAGCALSGKKTNRYHAELSETAFWLRLPKQATGFFEMDQARSFDCYVDVPGVGGGRDIPYERVELSGVHDLGGEKWFTTKDGQEIGISLFRVMWPMNNYDGIFTRPSLVIYAKTKEEGKSVEKGYAWTSPDAQRVGINLKWMLANCYLISNADVAPFFKTNEPRL